MTDLFSIAKSNQMKKMKLMNRLPSVMLLIIPLAAWFSPALNARQDDSPNQQPAKTQASKETEKAWEYQPYQVKVWICTDRSAEIVANVDRLIDGLLTRIDLIDPCCLRCDISEAKTTWRHAFLENIEEPAKLGEVFKDPELENADKLMVVCLENRNGTIVNRIREYDIQTQQWGPLGIYDINQPERLVENVTNGFALAFMPIARVERITDKDEVFTRARAMKACVTVRRTETGEFISEYNEASPVWVKPTDRFLPVIRKVDTNGNLVSLNAIDFTFLTIEEQNETEFKCAIQSFHRAPLAGRTSKRAQKLALVIRPPSQPTTLTLYSRDEEGHPMEGIEVWSGQPGGDREDVVMLGKTDWKGRFVIPPSEDGMRLILLKRGIRPLMRLPIIPGLYPELETEVPDDEARLFAEGVITGLNNEVLNLVAQRSLYEAEISDALENKEAMTAREILLKYQELPSTQQLKNRLADEESQLKSQTSNQRELDYITAMFSTLKVILNSQAAESRERELREKIQQMPLSNADTSAPSN